MEVVPIMGFDSDPEFIYTIENNEIMSISSLDGNINILIDKLYNWDVLIQFLKIMIDFCPGFDMFLDTKNISEIEFQNLVGNIKIPKCRIDTVETYKNNKILVKQ